MPGFVKKARLSGWLESDRLSSYDILHVCRNLRALNDNIRNTLMRIETACAKLFENVTDNLAMSGINFLSESIEI